MAYMPCEFNKISIKDEIVCSYRDSLKCYLHCKPNKYKVHSQKNTITLLLVNNSCDFKESILSTVFHYFMDFHHVTVMLYFSYFAKLFQVVFFGK